MLNRPFVAMAACLVAAACVFPYSSLASESGSWLTLKHEYFWDKNGVWNHTPVMELALALTRKWSIGWEQEVDVVSGASRRLGSDEVAPFFGRENDAVSGASKVEVRHSENPSVTYAHGGVSLSGGVYYSDESDYTSLAPSAAIAWEFNERNTTLGMNYAEFFDDFHPQGEFSMEGGKKRITSLGATVAQTVSPLTLIGLTASYVKSWGNLGHPYNPPMDANGVMLTEVVPDKKMGVAISAQWVQGFFIGEALNSINLDSRSYADDWGLKSITLDAKWNYRVNEGTTIRFRGRYYYQTGTDFALPFYSGAETFRTADIRFYPFTSYLAGIRLASVFPDSWSAVGWLPDSWDIKYDFLWRDTQGDPDPIAGQPRSIRYQLYEPEENYTQGVVMIGMTFDLP